MPTYEYKCPKGHEFERFYRTISAGVSELPCPDCGEVATRQLSRSGLVFKGSGFYLTDYGKNAHRGVAPSNPEGSKSAGDKSVSKGDTAKSETAPKSDSGGDAKAESPKPKAESREPKAESPKPKAKPE